jgi:hypothetical protein
VQRPQVLLPSAVPVGPTPERWEEWAIGTGRTPRDGPKQATPNAAPPGRIEAASATRSETCVNGPRRRPAAARSGRRSIQRDAQLEAERARTEKAISAFAALADRLDALAAINGLAKQRISSPAR